nr:exocyst complex component SEC3A [Ipomoea batatas]
MPTVCLNAPVCEKEFMQDDGALTGNMDTPIVCENVPMAKVRDEGDSFDEACMHRNVEACEWLTGAIVRLDSPNLDSTYSNMRAVKEKRAELRILKMNFARRATDFLNQYVHDWTQNNAGYQHYILPLKVGATPKFSQRTQLVTENELPSGLTILKQKDV